MKKKLKQIVFLLLTVALIFNAPEAFGQQNIVKGAAIKSIKKKVVKGTLKYKEQPSGKYLTIKWKKGLSISWKKVKGAKKYQVEVYRYAPVRKKWIRIKKKTVKKPKYLLNDNAAGVKYKLRVRSYKNNSYSKWSKMFTVKPKDSYNMTKKGNKLTEISSKKLDRFAAEEAFILQNKERKKAGVSELQWDENLYQICEVRAKEISKDFSHTYTTEGNYLGNGFDGVKLGGENIAKGYTTPQRAIEAWVNSSGHYRWMIKDTVKTGAIGAYYCKGDWYWVAIFREETSEELIELNEKYGKVKFQ